jgi:hypothetical protein
MTDIQANPEYRASVAKLEECVREHHALLERIGNETDANEDGTEDTSVVAGWILVIGTVGFNSEQGEFHDAMVELPASLNNFTALGLARYGFRFLDNMVDNFSGDM